LLNGSFRLRKSLPYTLKVMLWSMRSWESVPRPKAAGGRTDSQDRMDQEEECAGKTLRKG
jgi:hypothetical protein